MMRNHLSNTIGGEACLLPTTTIYSGNVDLLVTLWPSFPHFPKFARDERLAGIRLNSAMISGPMLKDELEIIKNTNIQVPLYFDVKGRQLRVEEVHHNDYYLDITLNHPIRIADPQSEPIPVLFKAGEDVALLERVIEDGKRLLFAPAIPYGPKYTVRPGESLAIRHPSLEVLGPIFTDLEREKMELVREAGITRYFLSYVERLTDIWEFLGLVGRESFVYLKIESPAGLDFVANDYVYEDNIHLVAARGDLYVEIERPHEILQAQKLIIKKDPHALVGSRLLLSVVKMEYYVEDGQLQSRPLLNTIPDAADFSELAWLYDIGYRTFMLCDEICLHDTLLSTAVNVFDSFREAYVSV